MLPILETSLAHNTKEIMMDLEEAQMQFENGKSMHLDEELLMREKMFFHLYVVVLLLINVLRLFNL